MAAQEAKAAGVCPITGATSAASKPHTAAVEEGVDEKCVGGRILFPQNPQPIKSFYSAVSSAAALSSAAS